MMSVAAASHSLPVARACPHPPHRRSRVASVRATQGASSRVAAAAAEDAAAGAAAEAEAAVQSLGDTALIAMSGEGDEHIPGEPGIYAIYNDAEELQYVGLSRKVGRCRSTPG